ncbi:diacylglycerol kinase family protein [Desemzia sp. FAM 24101]|uniref:diacylglycerol kinase family protein n=1 Tax=unclassified Desemzia TaxID=2685243 RepID=UPI003889CDA6
MVLDENKKSTKNRRYLDSFKYAFMGVVTVFREERNMRTHVTLGFLVLLFSLFCKLSSAEWLWMFLCVFLVFVMEIWNTVIENVVDLVTDHQYHPIAKKAKDMAASAVLVTSLFSVVVGSYILLPKILSWFF